MRAGWTARLCDMNPPDEHVLSAFRAAPGPPGRTTPQPLGPEWDFGFRVGDIVYAQASVVSPWSARVREKLQVPGARVARPVLSTDGRYVVSGWKASQFIPGAPAKRVDEVAALALRLDAVLANIPAPFSANAERRDDVFAQAERTAFAETGEAVCPIDPAIPLVVGHADVLATTVFSGSNAPAILDIVPTESPRPQGFSAALALVDGMVAGAVDDAICDRFAHVPDIDQLLLRAVAYRRHVNNLHPSSKANVRAQIERVESYLVSRAGARM